MSPCIFFRLSLFSSILYQLNGVSLSVVENDPCVSVVGEEPDDDVELPAHVAQCRQLQEGRAVEARHEGPGWQFSRLGPFSGPLIRPLLRSLFGLFFALLSRNVAAVIKTTRRRPKMSITDVSFSNATLGWFLGRYWGRYRAVIGVKKVLLNCLPVEHAAASARPKLPHHPPPPLVHLAAAAGEPLGADALERPACRRRREAGAAVHARTAKKRKCWKCCRNDSMRPPDSLRGQI